MIVSENIGVSIINLLEIYMGRQAFVREVNSFPIKAPFIFKTEIQDEGRIKILMFREEDEVAFLKCITDGDNMWFEIGRTFENYRSQGYGTWIRAVAAWCAKRAGYKRIYQTSTRLANTPWTRRPTSAYIMNKLGFNSTNGKTTHSNKEHRELNLTQNIPNVNAVIRNIRTNRRNQGHTQ